jgi:hypothetical protein
MTTGRINQVCDLNRQRPAWEIRLSHDDDPLAKTMQPETVTRRGEFQGQLKPAAKETKPSLLTEDRRETKKSCADSRPSTCLRRACFSGEHALGYHSTPSAPNTPTGRLACPLRGKRVYRHRGGFRANTLCSVAPKLQRPRC